MSERTTRPHASTPPWWRRPIVTVAARIAISGFILWILVAQMEDIDTDELPAWNRVTAAWAVAAVSLTISAFVLAAYRWQRVLFALGSPQRLRRLFSHYMAGQFISNFVPTTVGGDVLRVSRLSKDTGDSPVSFASVVFERLSGWIVLPAITFVGFAVNPGLTDLGVATRVPLYVAGATLVALVILLVVLGNDRIGTSLATREGVARFGNAVHLGIDRMRARPREAAEVLAAAVAYQFVLILAAGCAAEAIGIDEVGLTSLMAFMPAVLILQVLPLGIGGLGIREGALVLFLGGLGVPDQQALALGLSIYAMTLVGSLIGFPLLILGGRARRPTPALADAATGQTP
jgi:uncharacterized membrane protein YbhN (UPF0104 family)